MLRSTHISSSFTHLYMHTHKSTKQLLYRLSYSSLQVVCAIDGDFFDLQFFMSNRARLAPSKCSSTCDLDAFKCDYWSALSLH